MPWFGGGGGNRTRVRKSSAVRPTYLAWSFGSRLAPAGRQAGAQPVASTDARGQATKPRTGADVNDAALRLRRSEERRVGKECRALGAVEQYRERCETQYDDG